jgi:hypothetical protein
MFQVSLVAGAVTTEINFILGSEAVIVISPIAAFYATVSN